ARTVPPASSRTTRKYARSPTVSSPSATDASRTRSKERHEYPGETFPAAMRPAPGPPLATTGNHLRYRKVRAMKKPALLTALALTLVSSAAYLAHRTPAADAAPTPGPEAPRPAGLSRILAA